MSPDTPRPKKTDRFSRQTDKQLQEKMACIAPCIPRGMQGYGRKTIELIDLLCEEILSIKTAIFMPNLMLIIIPKFSKNSSFHHIFSENNKFDLHFLMQYYIILVANPKMLTCSAQ